jgi:alpha-methylacyl-CoA racemase
MSADAGTARPPGLLAGLKVVELVSLGPGPFAAMLLSDLGADVIGIRRPRMGPDVGGLQRGRPMLDVDLKIPDSVSQLLELIGHADVLIEGFRPGVTERLGLGPDVCHRVNPRLVYGRMTGWGQSGPAALTAGHDINYIAITGALHAATRNGQTPTPPANLLGDFGGGGMYLVTAVLAALFETARTGVGRVLDVAIADGTTYLASMLYGIQTAGDWSDDAGTNLLDTGAPFYDVYPCADGRFIAVGAIEPAFFAVLAELLELDPVWVQPQARDDRDNWPALRTALAAALRRRDRDDWIARAGDSDACLAPVLTLTEARANDHLRARGVFGDQALPRLPMAPGGPPSGLADLASRWSIPAELCATLTSWARDSSDAATDPTS